MKENRKVDLISCGRGLSEFEILKWRLKYKLLHIDTLKYKIIYIDKNIIIFFKN